MSMRVFLALAFMMLSGSSAAVALDTQQTTQAIISKCSEIYKATGHPCPCPFDQAKNGSACGKRSAYDRPGGAAPICFAKDVTPEMAKAWSTNSLGLEERCAYGGR